MTEHREQRFMADAANLATEIAPERDLWPNIEAEITRPATRAGIPWFAQAAAVVALVGASSFITYELTKSDVQTSPVVTSVAFDAEFTSFGEELRLAPSFDSARNGLATDLDMVLDDLSPDARAEVEENLAVIRNAVADIKLALEREPGNEHLQGMLADAYREELAMMRRVGGLTRSVMSRNDI